MIQAIRHRLSRLGRDERGVAAIEFGVVAPVFFAMVLGIIDVGRYMWTLNTMQYAIDEAVRAGVVQQLPDEEIVALARTSLAGLDTPAITVNVDAADPAKLAITADTTYAFLFPISSFMDTTSISLRTEMPK